MKDLIRRIYRLYELSCTFPREDLYDVINKILSVTYNKKIELTPLNIEIAMNNKTEVIKLLEHGNDVNEINGLGLTPLIQAILLNNYTIAKLLIEKGALVEGDKEIIPILVAADCKSYEIIKLLIDNGADVNKLDSNGFNALHHLLNNGIVYNLKWYDCYLFEFGYNFHVKNNLQQQIISCIDLLISAGIDVNHVAKTIVHNGSDEIAINPLSIALECCDSKIVGKLIEVGSSRKAFEIMPSLIYDYQNSFDFINDIKEMDLSLWPSAPSDYKKYLDYKRTIKKYNIEVYTKTFDDGYKRPKLIKRFN